MESKTRNSEMFSLTRTILVLKNFISLLTDSTIESNYNRTRYLIKSIKQENYNLPRVFTRIK